ncbi:unnamed protein product [Prorocentrum cordatum]|uniref:Uncharacterized protein n=1 Tax=Prorocentrum cordatum TaxID=2364126 RepID=A0ABN9R3S3_9DINO|nr:unnamed protein product [Polarella glacialis]
MFNAARPGEASSARLGSLRSRLGVLGRAHPRGGPRRSDIGSFWHPHRMDSIGSWSRVFDFSLVADEDSITAGAVGLTRDLHFTVFRGKKPFSVTVSNFFELGEEVTMLCTVSPSGHMRVFKDGALVGENVEGMAPLRQDRPRMIVGGHYLYTDQAFHGSLRDVKMWNRELEWPMLGKAESSLVPKEGGWFPDDADTVLLSARKGKDVSIVGLVESFDGESTDADFLDDESLVSDSGGACS